MTFGHVGKKTLIRKIRIASKFMKFTLLEISNEPYLSYQAVLPHDQKVKTKI